MTLWVWGVSLFLFFVGLAIVVLRRQLLLMLLGLELMIAGTNIVLVFYGGLRADADILGAALLILAVAAGEAVVGLALILRAYNLGLEPDAPALRELRG